MQCTVEYKDPVIVLYTSYYINLRSMHKNFYIVASLVNSMNFMNLKAQGIRHESGEDVTKAQVLRIHNIRA